MVEPRITEAAPRRALVVDEVALTRRGIAAALFDAGFEVSATFHGARDALAAVGSERPDLVVLGAVNDCDLDDAVRRAKSFEPAPVLAVLLSPPEHSRAAGLIAAGAEVILSRGATPEELTAAVTRAFAGRATVAPLVLAALAGRVQSTEPNVEPIRPGGADDLSGREREMLGFLARGCTNREIAAALSLSTATVKSHLVHLYAKLGVRNRNEALGAAVRLGLLA
jgi:DNA-binding NarL/FixJ family response regulator